MALPETTIERAGSPPPPAMTTVFCGLSEETRAAVTEILSNSQEHFVVAQDAVETLILMEADCPSIVLVEGPTAASVAKTCSQLREADICQDAVLVAFGAVPDDAGVLLDAGADDVVILALGKQHLRTRLLVARRMAADTASHRVWAADHEQFFHLSLQLLCIAGFDGYFKMVNPAWTTTLGWSTADLLASPWLDLVHPEDRKDTIAATERLAGGHALIAFSNRVRRKGGGYRVLEWQATPSVERKLIHAVVTDITDVAATREALRESIESLTTTFDSIGDGVIATDLAGSIVRMNPVAQTLTGWSLAEARGKNITDIVAFVNSETRKSVESPLSKALREGRTVGLAPHTLLVRRNGTEIPLQDSCAPIKTSRGEVNGAVFVFRDLTKETEASAQQATLREQLIFSDRMAAVGTLAAGVAHEINNPLTYVAANLELALAEVVELSGTSSPRLKEIEVMLSDSKEGVARIAKIVRGLKTFSRVGEERLSVTDLSPVIELSINMALNEIRHRARLVRDYGPLPLVKADGGRLGQVFLNLLVNAAQAFAEERVTNEIRVMTATDAQGCAVIEVRDNGVGIPAALLSRIFDPFFTTKPVGQGTGLGLAISRSIVVGMGGQIVVHSEFGAGTSFRITLPPAAADMAVKPESNGENVVTGVRAARVLVIDDEPSVGTVIRRVLVDQDVTLVGTAQAALDLLATGQTFDVVLSDLMMPHVSGMELYRRISSLYPKMAPRVVFLTGGAFTPEANTFLDRVPNEKIEKPFDSEALRALIRRRALAVDQEEKPRATGASTHRDRMPN